MQMTTESDPMTVDPVLAEPPTITIAGKTYTLGKLGVKHVFRVARILGGGIGALFSGKRQPDGSVEVDPGMVAQVLVASMARNEEEVMLLMADLLGVHRNALNDPEAFPADSILDLFVTLSKHQDLIAFLAKVDALLPKAKKEPSETATA